MAHENDPERARQLLAEASYLGGRGFPDVDARTRSTSWPHLGYLQAQWRDKVGIEITWEAVELAEYLDGLRKEPPHLFLKGWQADYPIPTTS